VKILHRNPSVWRGLGVQAQRQLIVAALDDSPVSGLTHKFYRYPARFSPVLARAAIAMLSQPGDLVLDPFMGSGTTLVEALVQGRSAVGSDISSLATFIAKAKTTRINEVAAKAVACWAASTTEKINAKRSAPLDPMWVEGGYHRNLGTQRFWRIRNAIAHCLQGTKGLPLAEETLARAIILRTAQWALDSRRETPSINEFRNTFTLFAKEMVESAKDFTRQMGAPIPHQLALCVNCEAAHLESHLKAPRQPVKLVLTSPPYPGVHVLYHRWQVDGRKETPAPFWIANKLDGAGASYYTMGDRKQIGLRTYFSTLEASFRSIVRFCDADTTFVQVLSFSKPVEHLPLYLDVMATCGLREVILADADSKDGRLWRSVPNRRWYTNYLETENECHEVVLFHRWDRRRLRKSAASMPTGAFETLRS
jgi:DNA modification methylase